MSLEQIKGEESLFYIKYLDKWYPVGCLTSSPISEESEMIDTTTRDSGGWKTSFPTLQSYSIELSGMVVKDDKDAGNEILSYRKLRTFKRERTLIEWKLESESGYSIDTGKAYISSISQNDEVDSMISFSSSLIGFGKPLEDTAKVYVLGDPNNDVVYAEGNNLIETK